MTNKVILAIDPGDTQSAFVFVDIKTYKPLYFAKELNEDAVIHMLNYINSKTATVDIENIAIEMVASYGMAVGKSVFETCVWIGRFCQLFELSNNIKSDFIYRKDEKMCICGQMKAKDSNIRQALIDRFAKFDFKNGKGTKDNPDWFYGFKADCWAAYAVAVTWLDAHNGLYELKG